MRLLPDASQQAIIDVSRSVLERDLYGEEETLELRWKRYADVGLFGLGIPEEAGGAGLGMVEEALVAREVGRLLPSGPIVETSLAAFATHVVDPELARRIIDGRARVGLVVPLPARSPISSSKARVTYADVADYFIALPDDENATTRLYERSALHDVQQLSALDPG